MRISVFNCLSSANSRETQLMQHMKSNKKKPTKTRQIKKKQKRKRKKKTNKIEQEQKQNVKYHVMKEKNTRIIGIITVFNPDQFFLILTMQNIITVFLTIMFCLENLHGIFEYVGYIYLVYFMRKQRFLF